MIDLNGKANILGEIKFSIIVPVFKYDSCDALFKVFDSESEVIIIDSSYDENVYEKISKLSKYKSVKYIKSHSHHYNNIVRGLATSLNTGIAVSTGNYLVLLKAPVYFQEDYFKNLKDTLRAYADGFQREKIAVIGIDSKEHNTASKIPFEYKSLRSIRYDSLRYNKDLDIIGASSYCVTVNRGALIEINGLDERYDNGTGFRFANLFLRLQKYGIEIIKDYVLKTAVPALTDSLSFEEDMYYPNLLKTNALLWNYDRFEINNGKVYAYNSFNLHEILD